MHADDDASKIHALRQKPRPAGGRKAKATSQKAITDATRLSAIIEMRIQGWSLAAIGGSLAPAITAPRVHQILTTHLQQSVSESTASLRALELARLDEMEVGIYERAVNGDFIAIDRILSIMERRARLLGLNSPLRAEVSGPDGAPMNHRLEVEHAARSFDAKASIVLENMKRAREANVVHEPSAD